MTSKCGKTPQKLAGKQFKLVQSDLTAENPQRWVEQNQYSVLQYSWHSDPSIAFFPLQRYHYRHKRESDEPLAITQSFICVFIASLCIMIHLPNFN